MLTELQISNGLLQLQTALDQAPPIREVFQQIVLKGHQSPPQKINATPEQVSAAREAFHSLSQKRQSVVIESIDHALSMVTRCLDRTRLLIRNRKQIYADDQMQRCVGDIQAHQNLAVFYFEPVSDLWPSFESYHQRGLSVGYNDIDARKKETLKDYEAVTDHLEEILKGIDKTKEETEAYYTYAGPLPTDIPTYFTKLSYDLAMGHTQTLQQMNDRMGNINGILGLIDGQLIPSSLFDETVLNNEKILLQKEFLKCVEDYSKLANIAKGNFIEVANRLADLPKPEML